jgi:hypothetical protein
MLILVPAAEGILWDEKKEVLAIAYSFWASCKNLNLGYRLINLIRVFIVVLSVG